MNFNRAASLCFAALGLAIATVLFVHFKHDQGFALFSTSGPRLKPAVENFELTQDEVSSQPDARFRESVSTLSGNRTGWRGTYVGGDSFVGRVVSTPFLIQQPELCIPIAGYPHTAHNDLAIEVLDRSHKVVATLHFTGPNPKEEPGRWDVSVKAFQGQTARLVLVDGEATPAGWLGVAAPMKHFNHSIWASQVQRNYVWFSIVALTLAALLFLPGVALRVWYPKYISTSPALWPLPGLILLVVFGLIAWIFGPSWLIKFSTIWLLAHLSIAGALARKMWRGDLGGIAPGTSKIIICYICVVLSALAFGVLPLAVAREMQPNETDHSRMIASPPDHRIPFETAAIMYYRRDPKQVLDGLWSIASRGPLVPLALVSAFAILDEPPGEPIISRLDEWPANRDAFYLARILGVLTNAFVVLGVAALAYRFSPKAGPIATVWIAVAPITAINTDFLWPKLLASFFIVLAVLAAIEKRSLFNVAVWGSLAYLSHPVGALFLPPLALFIAHRDWPENSQSALERIRVPLQRAAGLTLWVILLLAPWLLFKAWIGRRDLFADYPLGDGNAFTHAASVISWLSARFDNLWLTLVPGGLYFSNAVRTWESVPIAQPLRWAIGYAKSLPGNIGLAAFCFSAIDLLRDRRVEFKLFKLYFFALALLIMLVFWGFSRDGLGRNCLEPLSVLFVVYSSTHFARRRWWRWLLLCAALEAFSVRVIGLGYDSNFTWVAVDTEASVALGVCLVATLIPALLIFADDSAPKVP